MTHPQLRPGEQVLLADRESRQVRGLTEGLVAVLSIMTGVAFNAFVLGGSTEDSGDTLITIMLALAPIFALMSLRARSRVVLTDQRVIVDTGGNDIASAEYHQITRTRRWLATLFLRLHNGETLSIGNMRSLNLIDAIIEERRRP